MNVTTIFGLVFASTALGNYVDGGDYPPYGPYNITSYALSCVSYRPSRTATASTSLTYQVCSLSAVPPPQALSHLPETHPAFSCELWHQPLPLQVDTS
jgi:hypothetical protein